MALTILQKSDIRRHLGYPVIGLLRTSAIGGTLGSPSVGYRYHDAYGFLEYRMNNLNPDEEARITGQSVGAVMLVGPQPNPGDTLSVTFSGGPLGSPVVVTATAPATINNVDARITMMNLLAAQVATNTTLQGTGFYAATPYGTGPLAGTASPVAELAITCGQVFTMAVAGTGAMAPQISSVPALPAPYAQLNGTRGVTTYGYVPNLNALESAYLSTSQNLDTAAADVWRGRMNELGQRRSLYEVWIDSLVDFLGVPRNQFRRSNASRRSAVRYA